MNAFDRILIVYNFTRPFLDVLILAFILYKAYGIIVKTHGMQIIRAVIITALEIGRAHV